jgi:Flp pilus assembly protein TadG
MGDTLRRLREKVKGQSMVELALVLPILLILFLGLIELGMALRAYLVLVNANREAARFAGRGTFSDAQIARQALYAFAGQLPARTIDPDANTRIIVTRFHVKSDESEPATFDQPVYITGTIPYVTKIDPQVYAISLKSHNDQFNDELEAKQPDAVRTTHEVIFVEVYYLHHQALHAPIVEWIFPEPMVLYSRTMMRVGTGRVY